MRLAQWQSLQELYRRELRERGYQSDPAQLAAVAALSQLRQRLIRRRRHERSWSRRLLRLILRRAPAPAERGIYLWGQVGRGKTWLMDLFHRSLPFAQTRRRHFHHFMQEVHAALKTHAGKPAPLELVAAGIAAQVRVLCFDELFVADIADAMILGTLFEALFRRGVTLVATSNVPPEELYRDGLQRQRFVPAIELLERNTLVLTLEGSVDYRLRRLRRAGTYLSTADPRTHARLMSLFRALAEGAPGTRTCIEIAQRRIAVVGVGAQVVWFQFSALCEGPRGTEDYIEIARLYSSVIVAEVPVFTAAAEDAARRFIALVDELYDHDVKLVLSAAAPPAELYRGEQLHEEFQRTQSRLSEMQTQEYLARSHRA